MFNELWWLRARISLLTIFQINNGKTKHLTCQAAHFNFNLWLVYMNDWIIMCLSCKLIYWFNTVRDILKLQAPDSVAYKYIPCRAAKESGEAVDKGAPRTQLSLASSGTVNRFVLLPLSVCATTEKDGRLFLSGCLVWRKATHQACTTKINKHRPAPRCLHTTPSGNYVEY